MDKIVLLHSDSNRAYHTICHLEEMFGFLDILQSFPYYPNHNNNNHPTSVAAVAATRMTNSSEDNNNDDDADDAMAIIHMNELDQACIELAIFFHDIIYNVKSSTNEEDSALLLKEFLTELSQLFTNNNNNNNNDNSIRIDKEGNQKKRDDWNYFVERTSCYILATKSHNHHYKPSSSLSSFHNNHDREERYELGLALFLDADMAVLGKTRLAYQHYAASIRIEYQHVPRSVYCEKRADILESFCSAVSNDDDDDDDNQNQNQNNPIKYIFATNYMRTALEEQARTNLTLEIQSLREGIIPQERKTPPTTL